MRKKQSLFVMALPLIFIVSCGSGDDEGDGGSGGGSGVSNRTDSPFTSNTVLLKDSDTVTALQVAQIAHDSTVAPRSGETAQDCTIVADNYVTSGTCLYPVGASGNAMSVHLHMANTSVPGGTRLLGVDEYSETPGSILGGANFDLFTPVSLSTNNTLQTQYSAREQYDAISVDAAYYHIKFPLTFNGGDTTKWVTMHLAMYGQPFSESAAVTHAIANCGLSENDVTQSRYMDADLLSGMSFNRGDYLFCVKDSESDTCSTVDFQWLDTVTNTLTSTRPAQPKQSHWLANNAIECTGNENGSVDFNFGPFGLFAEIERNSQFKLWSDFSHAEYSNQWPSESHPFGDETLASDPAIAWIEPFYLYYFNTCPSGACSNEISQGSALDVTLSFETAQMVFIDGITESEATFETEIGVLLADVHTRTQWGFDQKSADNIVGYDVVDLSSMTVSAAFAVTGGTEPPANAIVYCQDLDPANADEDGCSEQQ